MPRVETARPTSCSAPERAVTGDGKLHRKFAHLPTLDQMYLFRGWLWIVGRMLALRDADAGLWIRRARSVDHASALGWTEISALAAFPRSARTLWMAGRSFGAGLEPALDGADRVEDGRVVAVEAAGDLGERQRGELAGQVHGELPRLGDAVRGAAARASSARLTPSQLADGVLDRAERRRLCGRRTRHDPRRPSARPDDRAGERLAEHRRERQRRGSSRPRGRGRSRARGRRSPRAPVDSSRLGLATAAIRQRRAIRVRRSGGSSSTVRPQSKRSRSRSASCASASGGRSLERTICLPAACRALKVWTNSSSVLGLPSSTWTSSISSASSSR